MNNLFVFKLEFIYLKLYLLVVNVNLCEIFLIVFEWLDS